MSVYPQREFFPLLVAFCEDTTVHGLRRGFQPQRSLLRKVLWRVLVLIAISAFLAFAVVLIRDFLQYPKVSSSTQVNTREVDFPTVTLCNANAYRASALNGTIFEPLLVSDISSIPREMTVSESIAYSHQVDEMIVSCSYGGNPCGGSDWVPLEAIDFSSCFRFNANGTLRARQGVDFGLTVQVDVQQAEYLATSTLAGIQVYLHSSTSFNRNQRNVWVSPGTSANVWTERSVIQRLGKPYGDCTTNTADKDCFKFCVDDRVAALCDCAWVQRTGLTLCTASTNTQLQCAIDIFDDFLSPSPSCECPPPLCSDVEYTLSYGGQMVWPSDVTSVNVSDQLGASVEELRRSVLRLNIIIATTIETHYNESPKQSNADLFSAVGGLLGLFAGISLLSVAEWVEFVVFLFWNKSNTDSNSNMNNNNSTRDDPTDKDVKAINVSQTGIELDMATFSELA